MDLETFYEMDETRRQSAEFERGNDWSDANGNKYELSWVEDTGELYLMSEPDAAINEDIFGDFLVSEESMGGLQVLVIGRVTSLSALEEALEGWEDAMLEDNSLAWLYERFPQESAS
jgi:hypothetical protein